MNKTVYVHKVGLFIYSKQKNALWKHLDKKQDNILT